MGYREQLTQLVKKWTEDNIDITDNWNEWENFLTEQGYIRTYDQVYNMEIDYLMSNGEYQQYKESGKTIHDFINDDNDITEMENGCYFVHSQEYIDDYIIHLFYEQKTLKQTITQAYIDLKCSHNGFNRFESLLTILKNNFGKEKLYFCTEIDKVQQELLYCIDDVLKLINFTFNDGSIRLWIPDHNLWSDEEDDHYCKLIKFGGYEILEDGNKILNSDVIILKDEESIQSLDYYTYQNIDSFCNYIEDIFKFYRKDCVDAYDIEYLQDSNESLNRIINKYWMNTIEFDYAQFLQEN